MEALSSTAITVLQLFSLISIGWLLANKFRNIIGIKDESFWGILAKFVYMISLPAMIIHIFADFQWNADHKWFVGATVGTTIAVVILTLILVPIFSFKKREGVTIASIVTHPNCVFLGFPLIETVIGHEALPLAVLFSVIEFPIVTLVSIVILHKLKVGDDNLSGIVFTRLKKFSTDPVIMSCFVGVILSLTPISLPGVTRLPLQWLGGLASPLALLVIGSRMRLNGVRSNAMGLVFANVIRLVAAPLLAFVACILFQVDGVPRAVIVLLAATPIAASTILIVEQHGGDGTLTANAITVTTLASLITLSLVAFFVV